MDLELRHLHYFVVLAEEMHFGRAAERLHIAQPSLSQQIRRLEEIVGASLVDRSRRAIELTPAGETLAVHARRTFVDVDAALVATRDAAAGRTGRLSVGFIETAAISIVPAAARRFLETRPRVTLDLRELPVRAQIERLVSGSLDLGFIRGDPGHDELLVERAREEDFVIALPAAHPLSGRKKLSPEEVMGEPLVMIEREIIPGLYDETMALARKHGVTIRVARYGTSILSILGLVSAGTGVAVLPDSVRSLALADIRYVDLEPGARTAILAVRHRDNRSSQIDEFLETVRALPDGPAPGNGKPA